MGLDEIERDLARVAKVLDRMSAKIRDADLDPQRNVRRIGEALVNIFEIRHDIYRKRPDLLPRLLVDTDLGREVLPKVPPKRRRGSSTKS